jgi:hypothetical protein
MSSPRIMTIALILVLTSHFSWTQDGCGDDTAQENLARFSLRDISERGKPLRIVGYVTFQDNPAENVRSYWVHASAKNVSMKGISAWSGSIETTGGIGPELNLSESHDFFFTGDVIAQNGADGVQSCPTRLVLGVGNGKSSTDTTAPAPTASVRVTFVQFSDGSIWGDSDEAAKAHQLRRETLQKIQSLQQVYSERGEKAFMDALAEPTALPCFERIKTLCENENTDSICARKEIQQMVAIAAQQRSLEAH